jgi:hypothetical protein
VVALLPSAAIAARKAETYFPETYVIDLADLRRLPLGCSKQVEGGRISALTREAEHRVHPVVLAHHSLSENPVRTVTGFSTHQNIVEQSCSANASFLFAVRAYRCERGMLCYSMLPLSLSYALQFGLPCSLRRRPRYHQRLNGHCRGEVCTRGISGASSLLRGIFSHRPGWRRTRSSAARNEANASRPNGPPPTLRPRRNASRSYMILLSTSLWHDLDLVG